MTETNAEMLSCADTKLRYEIFYERDIFASVSEWEIIIKSEKKMKLRSDSGMTVPSPEFPVTRSFSEFLESRRMLSTSVGDLSSNWIRLMRFGRILRFRVEHTTNSDSI